MNVLIIGKASREKYLNTVLNCDPTNLKVLVSQDDFTPTFKEFVEEFQINASIVSGELIGEGKPPLHEIILYTTFIGVNVVLILEDAIKRNTKVTIVTPL